MKRLNPKIVIAGWPHLANLARSVISAMDIPDWVDIEISELPLQAIADTNQSLEILESVLEPYNILISGDRSAISFSKQLDNLVIPVKVTGFDFLQTIQDIDTDEIIVLNFHENIPEIDNTAHLLKTKVRQETYQSYLEATEKLKSLQQAGVPCVVGGSWICNEAENYGLRGYFYYSERAMREALSYALNTLEAYRKEMEQSLFFKTIVDFNSSGVIATDQNLKVTVCSPSAEQLLGMSKKEMIGQTLTDLFPQLSVEAQELSGQQSINRIINQNSKKIEAEIVPITMEDSERFGVIAILDDIADLQKKELQIRKKLNQKRLVAHYSFADIIGSSTPLKNTLTTAQKYSQSHSAILIQGESGTGKELFAQGIHNASDRRNQAFVAVNCAALPESLLNSELFGYEEGAFTGAKKGGKPGLFELAHKGTIFLDEISELPLPLQSRLLRVIQEKEVMRIGGDQNIPVDVRIITAANKDLLECVQKGTFREDLYYRIGVLVLHVPPLRERLDDIPLLLTHFLKRHGAEYLDQYVQNEEMMALLYAHDWPGNIRELENVLERFIVFCDGEQLDQQTAVEKMRQALYPTRAKSSIEAETLPLENKLKSLEKDYIRHVLNLCQGNKELAAKRLGISRTTLWRKLQAE
ncbi:propionate catabolism operon transcriptional regulator [Caldalkalibacillus uzonensis]|uniref:Propionate catabolism operon transcriptional regulator n=1 Tax=Caldalkalibacillus uzonensis TaxID=353224 RepID=A0ABU0CU71_9BACI|nr:sigma 54-interacting transcriptional regulator [Caldalkalibacillus uzonensis]MDQ0339954.1 propionate catabolism operon transcriptional regulator [Caldalkalibacillus uzonensis]